MTEELVPVFGVTDAESTAEWYGRLGFVIEIRHRFGPEFPLYIILRRGTVHLHLSEHSGDAPPGSYAYFYVDNIEAVAQITGAPITDAPWAREIELTDPDGNRLLVGQIHQDPVPGHDI